MRRYPKADLLTGLLLVAVMILFILSEWIAAWPFSSIAVGLTIVLIVMLTARVKLSRQVFVFVGLMLFVASFTTQIDWIDKTFVALRSSAFIAAFFTALASLRNASETSAAIRRCGHFLAQQPPGRRYLALTIGGHAFGLLLNYGSLVLLGHFAEVDARREPNAEIRAHRIRRMLLAIQRGFASTLPWSPLAFAMAITTTLVPGATWAGAVIPCLVSAFILASTGWGLDTLFKPRLSVPVPPRPRPKGNWASVLPLAILLAILGLCVGGVHFLTGIRAVGVVMLIVPIISVAWVGLQNSRAGIVPNISMHAARFLGRELPGYRSELILLMMAGFIGSLGSSLLLPLFELLQIDFSAVSGRTILIALVWLIPVAGQFGMNPIMSVSLIAPMLPDPSTMGIEPRDIVVALTAGWALAGASSPYTATTVFISAMGKVSAAHVGLRWNGPYTLVCGVFLSLWVAFLTLF